MSKVIGRRFGRLVVTERVSPKGVHHIKYRCQCDCGNTIDVVATSLYQGRTTSCGCFQAESRIKHNLTNTPTYKIWRGMRSRCNNPNNSNSKYWHDRGIRVCDRWESYENFLADMGERPEGMTIDRMNPDKGYSPDNCRWATRKEQQQTTRRALQL